MKTKTFKEYLEMRLTEEEIASIEDEVKDIAMKVISEREKISLEVGKYYKYYAYDGDMRYYRVVGIDGDGDCLILYADEYSENYTPYLKISELHRKHDVAEEITREQFLEYTGIKDEDIIK